MTRNPRRLRPLVCLLALAVPALAGCSKAGSVSGKVKLKGEPLTAGTVTFVGSDQKVVTAPIEPDGSYTITRVAVGPAKISIDLPAKAPAMPGVMGQMDPSKMGGGGEKPEPPPKTKPVRLPEKYRSPDKSGLTYTVKSGSQEYNIDLE